MGEERFTAGQRALAQDQLHEAANQARRLGRADILARCAIAIRGFGEFGSRPAPRDEALIAEALEALAQDNYALRASLLSRRAGGALVPMATRREYAEKAMALAVRSGDDIALRDALSARWWASLGPDRLEERHRIAQEMFALAEKTGDPQIMLLSHESEIGAG